MINKYMNECCPELQVQTALYQENSCNIRSIGENHIYEIRFSGRSADEKRESEDGIELVFSVPMIGIEYQWHPVCGFDHALKADWSQDICTMTSFSAPVMSFYDGEGTNRLTFALSELKKNVRLNAGVHEEDGTLRIRIRILADDLVMNEVYGLKIYMDFKAHAYYKALDEVRKWWEDSCGIVPAEVPKQPDIQCIPHGILFIRMYQQKNWRKRLRRQKNMVLLPLS